MQIAFFNTGPSTDQAEVLCRSARRTNPEAVLVQLTDQLSPPVHSADKVIRIAASGSGLMLARVHAFSQLDVTNPTWFLDTDMLLVRPLQVLDGPGFCVREFHCDKKFNHTFGGLDFSEYKDRNLADVYPILGCATFLNGTNIWSSVLSIYEALESKYHAWYGDQEALKAYTQDNPSYTPLPESIYACLPEFARDHISEIKIIHFKGSKRKNEMMKTAHQIGLLRLT